MYRYVTVYFELHKNSNYMPNGSKHLPVVALAAFILLVLAMWQIAIGDKQVVPRLRHKWCVLLSVPSSTVCQIRSLGVYCLYMYVYVTVASIFLSRTLLHYHPLNWPAVWSARPQNGDSDETRWVSYAVDGMVVPTHALYMWQSRVENRLYSVACFNHVTVFKTRTYEWGSYTHWKLLYLHCT